MDEEADKSLGRNLPHYSVYCWGLLWVPIRNGYSTNCPTQANIGLEWGTAA